MVNKIEMLDDSQFIELITSSTSTADVLRKLNYSVKGNSWAYQIIKDRMTKLQISFIKNSIQNVTHKETTPLDDILIENSDYPSSRLRSRLIKEGLKEEKCEKCKITEWQGMPLNFELHHINGIHTDNRLENLQILCPNCHSQTENYGCKNHQMSVNPSSQEIPESVKKEIMDKVSEVGVIEARKQLSYRNSLINKVVKENHNIIVLISPNGKELEFPTIKGAAIYINSICGLGASVESVRSNLSNILAGRQKRCQGFTCYKKQQI